MVIRLLPGRRWPQQKVLSRFIYRKVLHPQRSFALIMADRQSMECDTLEKVLDELATRVVNSSDPERSLEVALLILTQSVFGPPDRRRKKMKPLRI